MPITTDKATQAAIAKLYDAEAAATVAVERANVTLTDLRVKADQLKRRIAQEQRAPLPRPAHTPVLVDALASDPNAVLDEAGMDAEIEAQHAIVTRAERKRAAKVGMFQAALNKLAPLIAAAERAAADAERDWNAATGALNVAVYDALLAIAAERMQALASEVLLPITRMSSYEQRGGFGDMCLRMHRVAPVSDNGHGGTTTRFEQTFFSPAFSRLEAQQVDLRAVYAQLAGRAGRAR